MSKNTLRPSLSVACLVAQNKPSSQNYDTLAAREHGQLRWLTT